MSVSTIDSKRTITARRIIRYVIDNLINGEIYKQAFLNG